MSWPSPPKLIRNSTPTTLIKVKISPSRTPTKMVGSAAGNRILMNNCGPVSLKLRPTLMSTRRVPDRPSMVFRITGGRPATKPIMMMVQALRHADDSDHRAGRERLEERQAEALADVFLDDDALERHHDLRGQGDDEA